MGFNYDRVLLFTALRVKQKLEFLILSLFIIVSLPIFFAYSDVNDNDSDGIPNDIDYCPHQKEDHIGTADGCPSVHKIQHDTDSDGILDNADECPNMAESYNKYQDEDGCPDVAPVDSGRSIPDSDGDGIHDVMDSCPNQPETYNGILDLDGCPDDVIPIYDSDYDGIPDNRDQCPTEPELYNKYQDEDGCPESPVGPFGPLSSQSTGYQFPDADNDGMNDRWDQCLDQAENYNGYLDRDGCPDVIPAKRISTVNQDSDRDGITDSEDQCPTSPETWNKFDDKDGCPDQIPGQSEIHD